jgi:hypothetical protein
MVLLAAPALAACGENKMPGTQLGTYKVTATSQTNTCGLGAPNPWTFDVQLSQDGSTLYWSWMDGTPYLSGPVSGTTADMTASEQANVDGTTDGGLGPCTMQRNDTLQVDLGSGSFTGTISYAIAATPGSDCSDQLVSASGQYDQLPCSMTYSVTAATTGN